jgi:hypothetical protein
MATTTSAERPNLYRFGDSTKVGMLLGLNGRQSALILGGLLLWAFCGQVGIPWWLSLMFPVVAFVGTFARIGGAPLAEVLVPGLGLVTRRASGEGTWTRQSLLGAGPGYEDQLPRDLAGLEIIEVSEEWLRDDMIGMAVVLDNRSGTLTAVLKVSGGGFSLATPHGQDGLVASWGTALAPFAREKSPVTRVVWHERAQPVGMHTHEEFLAEKGLYRRLNDELVRQYVELVDVHASSAVTHEVLLSVTVDRARVRNRRGRSATSVAMEVLCDEVGLFMDRLAGSLTVGGALGPPELSKLVRVWSDPPKLQQVETYARSLAAATGRGVIEWGPMAVEPHRRHVVVDGSYHRTYRVAAWPQLAVHANWLDPLLSASDVTRTVTVVLEPVPIRRAANQAEREVTSREADADERERQGFRVSARDRKRLDQVKSREAELAYGHPEFRFVGLVDVVASDLDRLDDAAAQVEQVAAQSLLDLRPLDFRHGPGWVASLPLGRSVAPGVMGS